MSHIEIYQVQELEKAYGDQFTLRVASLSVAQGDILAVLGPSGAGKSTFLRLLNFLEPPLKGTIRFLGQDYCMGDEVPLDVRRQVTTVFQQPLLLNRTVWSNVAFGLKLRGAGDMDAEVEAILAAMGLLELAQQPARRLSGGEAQRAALARAMLLQPEVLLLDEPTANLDPYNVGLIEDTIQQLSRDGTTIILVTHNLFQARRLANRAVLLIDGEVVHTGGVGEFFEDPRPPLVQAFVEGDMVY